MAEFRKDLLLDRWTIISTERAKRPQPGLNDAEFKTGYPCPFCAGNEAMTPAPVLVYSGDESESSNASWLVRVVPNKYPAVFDDGEWVRDTNGTYDSAKGIGVHEVLIESPHHVLNSQELSQNQFEKILRAYRDRIVHFQKDKRWRYVLIYKNQGLQGGATLEHAHSQIIALPMIPKEVQEEIAKAKIHHERYACCAHCRLLEQEMHDKDRIVAESEHFIVLCPFASRFPYETWILPKKHESRFEAASPQEQIDLAGTLRETLLRLARRLKNPPFNYIIHSHPLQENDSDYYHWHMEILPRLGHVAGFEWGSGMFINPVAPENAARILRDAAP